MHELSDQEKRGFLAGVVDRVATFLGIPMHDVESIDAVSSTRLRGVGIRTFHPHPNPLPEGEGAR